MDRNNNQPHSQQETILSQVVEMAGKKSGLPKSTLGWVGALALLGYIRGQFNSMDDYVQKTASSAPAIIKFQSDVGTNFNDLGKELVILKYRLDRCDELAPKVQQMGETLAVLKSTGKVYK